MPELPEVETLRRVLTPVIVHRKIIGLRVLHPKLSAHSPLPLQKAIGKSIRQVQRRAKLLMLHLSEGLTLVIHLKMTGQLAYRDKQGSLRVGGHPITGSLAQLPNSLTAAWFRFSDRSSLYFNDQRRFAYLVCLRTEQLDVWLDKLKLGPEPLDRRFTLAMFRQRLLRHPNARCKDALLNQSIVAGLGNIYADEVDFIAKVHPRRRVRSLNESEVRALHQAIKTLLAQAVRKKGTTFHAFGNGSGMGGTMQSYLHVYGRTGQPCKKCAKLIVREKLGSRSAHYCPQCQKMT